MWCAIILAGGSGSRMGAGRNKVLIPVCGTSMLERSVRAMLPHADCLVVAARADEIDMIRGILSPWKQVAVVTGGDTRQASVRSALFAIPPECDNVMVHDAARCLVDDDTIRNVKESVDACGTGVAAIPAYDTIKQVDEQNYASATPDRTCLRVVQTPQGFRTELLRKAHEKADKDGYLGTDDASLLEHLGLPVRLVPGNRRNIKLTTPEDIAMAEALLGTDRFRVGTGYDVHRLTVGRKLILCGVEIPHPYGLDGHSDADVALHALMDAMLGAMALGDIGQHFPDTDERYRGISSVKLLHCVQQLLLERNAQIMNVDITIVAQRPKLMPYIHQMRETVANELSLPLECVSVKATTTEQLGFEGRMEGISAQSAVMIREKHFL